MFGRMEPILHYGVHADEPSRYTVTHPTRRPQKAPSGRLSVLMFVQSPDVADSIAPVGIIRSVAHRHNAINNFRARATIPRLRDRPSRAQTSFKYHRVKALSG